MKSLLVLVLGLSIAAPCFPTAKTKLIRSMAELEQYSAKSGHYVKMKPGVYQLTDVITPQAIERLRKTAVAKAKSKAPKVSMFVFSGDNNRFDLTGVTIEVDTRLLSAFKGCDIQEFLITGNNNEIEGLTITDIGNNPTIRGGRSFAVYGNDNTLKNVELNVRGSSPYGYGDLLGKGRGSVVRLQKHSGLLICGTNTKLLGCRVINRSFGHCFFIQGGRNTYFENCYAEGEMRATDDMLAETSGLAFENNFKTVYKPNVIQPGYMKSLQECGFRTYGKGGPEQRSTGKVTLVNCTAKNVRVGFAMHADEDTEPVEIRDCVAIECERGYHLDKVNVSNSTGDAMYGPLMYLFGSEASNIDITLSPETSDKKVHAIATIAGNGHQVKISGSRDQPHPILLGYHHPPAGEISAPIPEGIAENITLINNTGMPVFVGKKAANCSVTTRGSIKNLGKNIQVSQN